MLSIQNVKYGFSQGHAFASAQINGLDAWIGDEQKWFGREGIVFLGPELEDAVPEIVIPEDLEDGRDRLVLRGYSDDSQVLSVYETVKEMADTGEMPNG